jgi:cytoskeletal protein CcmA (bactofilin family)
VVVGGVVKGEITSTEKVIVLSTGLVLGNITTPRLIVEEGVILDGACRITAPERPDGDAGKAGAAVREPAPAAAVRR